MNFQLLTEWLRERGWLAKKYGHEPTSQLSRAASTDKEFICNHEKPKHDIVVSVLDVEYTLSSSPMCLACAKQYLNEYSTLCASCKRPIFPGTDVGQAWNNAPHPHTHLEIECCDTAAHFCGRWGQGYLITLHELDPQTYPEGTASLLSHALNVRGIVIEIVN